MGTTEAVLGEMTRRRAELFLQGVVTEYSTWQKHNRVLDGEDLSDFTQLIPNRISSTSGAQLVARNFHGHRPIRRAFDRMIGAIAAGELQWTGDSEDWPEEAQRWIKELTRHKVLLAERLIAHGQCGLLPWNSPAGPKVTPLGGFLFAIPSDYDSTTTSRLLAFEGVAMTGQQAGVLFNVFELEEGRIRMFTGVRDMVRFDDPARLVAQVDVPVKGLPVAHEVLLRDTNGAPMGLVELAVSAHWAHRQRLFQKNLAYFLAGLPQRTASGVDEGADDFDPLTTIYLPADGKLEYPFPRDSLSQLEEGEKIAAAHVMEAMHAPNVSDGAGESGEARLMSLEEHVQFTSMAAEKIASCLTRCSELMAEYGLLPGRLEFELTPEFSAQRTASQQNVILMFEKGLISRAEAILRLQTLGVDISQEELDNAVEERKAQSVPGEPLPGEDDSATDDAEEE
jgi:hypothetical protein